MFSRLDVCYQKEVVEAIIQHICCSLGGDSENGGDAESLSSASVVLLQNLVENHLEVLVKHSDLTVALLGCLKNLSLFQVKKVTQLLAKIAYGFPDSYQPQDR